MSVTIIASNDNPNGLMSIGMLERETIYRAGRKVFKIRVLVQPERRTGQVYCHVLGDEAECWPILYMAKPEMDFHAADDDALQAFYATQTDATLRIVAAILGFDI